MSLRDKIMASPIFDKEVVDVAAWNAKVEVRSMSLAEKVAITERSKRGSEMDLAVLLPGVIVATCFDPETGDKLFTADDVEWLQGQSAGTIETVSAVGIRISGLAEKAVDAPKDGS